MKNDILRKCPFCGSKGMVVRVTGGYTPMCTNFDCLVYGVELKRYKTVGDAIEVWNRRVKDENS